MALFRQKQVVEFDDNIGKVSELYKVRGDDVDPVHPRPLSLNPGHDGWQVSRAEGEESLCKKGNQTSCHMKFCCSSLAHLSTKVQERLLTRLR